MNLSGKTVLLLAPKFFGYELEIKKELENLGARVIYFDERPKNDFFTKVFIRLNLKKFISRRINIYYRNIIENIKDENIDYLFLVAPETISIETIKEIKSIHKNMKIFAYFWDSIKNKKTALEYLDIADKYFTFDSNDIKIDKRIEFLPLFYIKDYEVIADVRNNLIYDTTFIGTVHSDRYKIIKDIEKQLENKNTFFYFYSPSRTLFFFQKLLKKDFRNIKWKDVSFKSMKKEELLNKIKESKCIIDIQHPLQSGLTMRTIEMLGVNKKIITTNENIINYDFYNENNILILDRNNIQINNSFFDKEYQIIEDNIYQKYSLRNWLEIIFK
ncbi:hypothetical protein N5S72_09710 [Aliarcobacter cryaerophilus]|uniref:hypothetical protein n=1 Tax=Aliarcobacter cryaerophilus TaxID=28198 RepID=UPI0021B3778B|nr:hypothetical protein [Aliarcobacter cryaerophilus]MCT7464724.1 hypothetical protein [Aliarcobacter cryaerophilus]